MTVIDAYDAALFDLDGVIYLGPDAIPGAAEAVSQLRQTGVRVGFVTNNAARSPQTVADHLSELGVDAEVDDVVTSAQAIARVMAAELPAGAAVLVCGTAALRDEVVAVGLTSVESSTDNPSAVVQGYDPAMTLPRLEDACHAIQHGARWFVSNTDSTRPTDKGLVPGAGALMNVVATAVDATPTIAGKPCTPLMEETVRRLGADRPLFVGDRIDTDIMGAVAVGMDSLLVWTGAHGKHDLLAAGPDARPTHIGFDLSCLQQPAREVTFVDDHTAEVAGQRATLSDGEVVLVTGVPTEPAAQMDALWAVAQVAWRSGGDASATLEQLDRIR